MPKGSGHHRRQSGSSSDASQAEAAAASSLLMCVQGSVALLDQDPEDGCFQCWPGSHKVHPDIMRLNAIGNTGNYYELGPDDKMLLERRGCNAYRIEVSDLLSLIDFIDFSNDWHAPKPTYQ